MFHLLVVIASALAMLVMQPANADCTDVIALSKTVKETTQGRDDFERNAATFCSEYKKGAASSKSANYGISYGAIAASMGTSKASEESIASKVCSTSDGESARKDAYREYVETISPKAYSAFEACESLKSNSISITVPTILAKEVAFIVSNARPTAAPALMQASATEGVNCIWESGIDESKKYSLVTGSSITLRCKRSDASKKAAITVLDISVASKNSLTIPWGTFDDADNSIDYLASLSQKLDAAMTALSEANEALRSSVVSFNKTSCPVGWDPYTPAYGRFVRGIDLSDSKIDPDGKRLLGSLQGDLILAHAHTLTLVGRSGNNAFVNRQPGWGYDNWHGAATSATTSEAGGAETRPKNVALLYCIKK